MSEVNIKNQISLPLLLCHQEIARYLNGIVNLEDIDKSLSNIQSMLRKETNQLESAD